MVPLIARLDVYPVKGFDAVTVDRATVLPSGALGGDRRWAFVDGRDRFVNGKQYPEIHRIRTAVDLAAPAATFDGVAFALTGEVGALETWMSARLDTAVRLREEPAAGFPDDTDSPGPTLIATATLEAVAGWFGLSLDEARARFRANVEIGGVPAFWEDAFYGRPCRIGEGGVALAFVNPCARCVVPSRHPSTGEALPGFQKRFADLRRATLAAGVDPTPFDHTYRLAVNTRLAPGSAGGALRVGDRLDVGVTSLVGGRALTPGRGPRFGRASSNSRRWARRGVRTRAAAEEDACRC